MKILLVEDHVAVATTTILLLKVMGHTVVHAKNGQEALDMAKVEMPELAVIDIGLPDMSGFDVAKGLRSEKALDNTVLVAVTGYDIESKMATSGFDHYFKKPMDFSNIATLRRTPAA